MTATLNATPLILAYNLLDTVVQNRSSVIANTSGDDVAGNDLWHIADNTRDATFWTTVGVNAARIIRLQNQSPPVAVAPNMLVLDRGHNLAGATVVLAGSTDNFATSNVTIATSTIPTVAGGLPTGTNGCTTLEGAWWLEFAPAAPYPYWQLTIPALGAGLAPIVTGLSLGVSYRFPEYAMGPATWAYRRRLQYQRNVQSRGGLRIRSRPLIYGELDLKFQIEECDYPALDTQVQALLYQSAPWWVCEDDTNPVKTGLLRLFQIGGDVTYDPVQNPVHYEVSLTLEEVFPRPVM